MADRRKLRIGSADLAKILSHAKEVFPEEACGLLAGEEGADGVFSIQKVFLLENTDHAEDHFTMAPKDQLAAVKEMRAAGLKQIGNWHSHPASPSRPSEEDIRLAYDRTASYLILSLQEKDHPVLNGYHIEQEDGVVWGEEILVDGEGSGVAVNVYPEGWG